MTPVISPWVFYFMYLADNISFVLAILFAALLIGTIIAVIAFSIDSYDVEEFKEKSTPVFKILIPALLVTGFLSCAIPTESTITKMIVAKNVTYERVDNVADTVETVYHDIMELFEEEQDG